jgi:hypothetical protein
MAMLTISTDLIQIINLAMNKDIPLQPEAQNRRMSQFGDAKESNAMQCNKFISADDELLKFLVFTTRLSHASFLSDIFLDNFILHRIREIESDERWKRKRCFGRSQKKMERNERHWLVSLMIQLLSKSRRNGYHYIRDKKTMVSSPIQIATVML